MSTDTIETEGTVVDCHAGGFFTVEAVLGGNSRRVLAKRSGRMSMMRIRIIPGDRVKLEIGAYDTSRGRITYRL